MENVITLKRTPFSSATNKLFGKSENKMLTIWSATVNFGKMPRLLLSAPDKSRSANTVEFQSPVVKGAEFEQVTVLFSRNESRNKSFEHLKLINMSFAFCGSYGIGD